MKTNSNHELNTNMKRKETYTVLGLIAALGLAGPATAQNPYAQPDDTFLSLSGTVVSTTPSSFTLDYGEGLVTVEMDDWDWYGDAYGILPDDNVTVYGYVDDDLFETTTIEASSVWADDIDTYFYASGADKEGSPIIQTVWYDYDYTVTRLIRPLMSSNRNCAPHRSISTAGKILEACSSEGFSASVRRRIMQVNE